VEAVLEQAPFETARWLSGEDSTLDAFARISQSNLAKDRDGNLVFLARSAWDVGYQEEKNPDIAFKATRER
jgi:peptide chain release factor 3